MPGKTIKHYTIPVFIPELACPFQCVFCNQRKISGTEHIPELDDIKKTIETHLSTIDPLSNIEIGFFGGNFTGIPVEHQEMLLSLANNYTRCNKGVKAIRISTRPDYIDHDTLRRLKKYNVKTIELGAQSLDEDVLRLSGRGHKAEDIFKASEMIRKEGFSLGLQMMIGLPGDTLEKSLYTAGKIIELGADNTRIYPTLVIRDTKLESLFIKGKYIPLSLDTAVNWSKEILKRFEIANVNVIRMGLHPSEGLLNGESLVCGPFHISFRELVLTEIWHDMLLPVTKMKGSKVEIHINPKEFNYAVGYNAKNKKTLEQNFRYVRFNGDYNLKEREFRAYFS